MCQKKAVEVELSINQQAKCQNILNKQIFYDDERESLAVKIWLIDAYNWISWK